MVEMVPEDLPNLAVKNVVDSGVGVNTAEFSLSSGKGNDHDNNIKIVESH
jgi:hypothetical protein